ncbi:MAG: ADOP family duplicated permease [Gemmatimonadota bacterium]|nr:ADOP family duplicated permease [Gemmatimonadota bacterium]
MWRFLYANLLRLFPPDFRREDRAEAEHDFTRLWESSANTRARLRLAGASFGRIPWALVGDWASWVTDAQRRRAHTRTGFTTSRTSMSDILRSIRHAVRGLRKNPAFSGSVVFLMALGIGAVTTIFTVVDHVLLRPQPYPDAERLVMLDQGSHSGPLVREMERLGTLDRVSSVTATYVNLASEAQPLRLVQGSVSVDFLGLFGAIPVRGRLLDAQDFDGVDRVVLSQDTWSRIWGEDPSIVGRTIRVDGEALTVVGVLDRSFAPPEVLTGLDVDIWRPLNWADPGFQSHERWSLEVAAVLDDGVSVADAQADVDALMVRMAPVHENYRTNEGEARSIPVVRLGDATVRGVRAGLGLLMGAVTLLLLVACANVAHLFMARGLGRGRELAVRRALGAGIPALVGHLAWESILLGLVGGTGGVLLALVGLRTFMGLNPESLPRAGDIAVDPRVLAFAGLLSVLTALVFGLLPALRAVRGSPDAELKASTRGGTAGRGDRMLRHGLIVAEVALSLVLVASASLLVRTFIEVQRQDPGFVTEDLWTIPLTPRQIHSPDEYRLIMDEVHQSVSAVPGVRSASYGLTMPLEVVGGGRCCWRSSFTAGPEGVEIAPWIHPVSNDFFTTLQIQMIQGGGWSQADATSTPIPSVVNEAFAIAAFGSAAAALNQRVRREGEQGVMEFSVTGVTKNTRYFGLDAQPEPSLFVPIEFLPFPIPRSHVAVRVAAADAGLARRLQEAVWAVAPTLPAPIVRPMEEWMARGTARRRFDSALFGTFGIVALLLAAGGLYGTLLYMAGQRRRELAIRQALGASRQGIERWMLRGGVLVAGVGVAVGLVASWGASRLLESRLWGVEASDPVALLGAAAALLVVATVASWLPARWAGRTDPMEALQSE